MNGHRVSQVNGRLTCTRCLATSEQVMSTWCSTLMLGREVPIYEKWWLDHRGKVGRAIAVLVCGPEIVWCDTGDPQGGLTAVRLDLTEGK